MHLEVRWSRRDELSRNSHGMSPKRATKRLSYMKHLESTAIKSAEKYGY